jgi:hypothetical protein
MGMLEDLIRTRDEMSAKLEELNAEISQFSPGAAISGGVLRRGRGRPRGSKNVARSGAPRNNAPRGRGRPRNPNSLVESLRAVLSGKTYSVTDVAQAVQDAGYKTKSANFRTIVNQALLANPKIFRKIARGEYTAA